MNSLILNNIDIDIDINKLLIILCFILINKPQTPLVINNIINDYPIINWIALYMIIHLKYNEGFTYFFVCLYIYHMFYIIDNSLKL